MAAVSVSVSMLLLGTTGAWSEDVETIALVRHGEKPPGGLGQLDCQGLNRALALPSVVLETFGRAPTAVFAPNPAKQKEDDGKAYDYVRPLATVEPTAIASGLPVDASFGVLDTKGLQVALEQPLYRAAFVLVAWEHKGIESLARALLAAHGGDVNAVPKKWRGDDFDSIYVVTLAWTGNVAQATFARRDEGLDGQPGTCPH